MPHQRWWVQFFVQKGGQPPFIYMYIYFRWDEIFRHIALYHHDITHKAQSNPAHPLIHLFQPLIHALTLVGLVVVRHLWQWFSLPSILLPFCCYHHCPTNTATFLKMRIDGWNYITIESLRLEFVIHVQTVFRRGSISSGLTSHLVWSIYI